jgi:hypothetical protein
VETVGLSLCGGQDEMDMQVAPAQLYYDFCLDDHVPADHPTNDINIKMKPIIGITMPSM